jgi:eukaryotic-like serine/threonine-protein kinase
VLSAQDEAFVRLAIERGALAPGALAQLAGAPVSHKSAVQIVVDQGWVSSLEATGLLREVMSLAFGCQACGRQATYEGLSARASFACPCGGGLVPLPPQRPSSGSFPLPGADTSRGPEDSDFVRTAFGSSQFRATIGPGQVLGGYHLVRELGRGANGVVYLARRPGLEREFALKVLLEDQTLDAETIARFELEAAIGSKLRDPGVISVYDVGRVQDCLYYAMDYSPGPDLKEVLKERGRLPWEEGLELCRQLAESLAYCHDRSVIHRDLKPGNIILDSELNRPRVTDFGLARDRTLAQTMTATGDWLGTPYYMSPEQFRGEMDLDHRADIYALGTILFEVVTGERPYVAKSAQELMELVLEGNPPSPRSRVPELPAGLDHVVSKAMESEREDRYADAREFAQDLEALLAGRRLAPQRTRLAAGAFLVAAAAFAGIALLYHQRRGGPPPTQVAGSPRVEPAKRSSPTPPDPPTSGYDWTPLLADWKTWVGDLDLAALRAVRPALPPERLAALEATQELGRAARSARGAPWSDLNSILKRARGVEDWVAFSSRLDLLEARLLLARGRSRTALKALDKRRSQQALWLRSLAHEAANEAVAAEDLLERLSKGTGPEGALAKARLARAADELQRALGLIESAGEVPEAKLELAEVLLAAGDDKRAAGALRAYLERSGPSPRALRLEGELALKRGEIKAALTAFEAATALMEQDNDPRLVELLAQALLRADRSSDAVQLLSSSIPLARLEETLSPHEVHYLVLRGLARLRLGAKSRAEADWSRAGQASALEAREALLASASEEEREVFSEALRAPAVEPPRERPPVVVLDWEAEADTLSGMMGIASGPWRRLQALGKLSPKAARRFAIPETGKQVIRDLAAARKASAEGRTWEDVRFYLTRALDTGQAGEQVRATWMDLARGRIADLEAVAKRLADDPQRYGLEPLEAAFASAEMAWFQGRAGEALRAFEAIQAKAKGAPGPSVLLAGAHAALLRGEFKKTRELAQRLGEDHEDGRGFALAGLASLALNEHTEAAASQRAAYDLLGASDYRILALRAGLSAGNAPTFPLFGSTGPGAEARAYFHLTDRPAKLLTLRVLAESNQKDLMSFFVGELNALKEVELAELKQLRGYSWVRIKKERQLCLAAWKEARSLDARLPLPERYLEAYAEAYQTNAGLAELR